MGVTFRKNTIVVGAGASKEFGLPTGNELSRIIGKISDIKFDADGYRLASGDHQIVETLRYIANELEPGNRNINQFLHAAWKIRDNMALAPSIDNFLDTHREDQFVTLFGKLAICHAIQKAEAESALFFERNGRRKSFDFSKVEKTWLSGLFRILVAQRTIEDFREALSQITFVSFNYDRCIHQFFYQACTSYFSLNSTEAMEIVDDLNVIFPYGNVGKFTPSATNPNFGRVSFGQSLFDAANNLKTFTEGVDAASSSAISDSISESEIVLFLGFGFLPLNMEILFGEKPYETSGIFGTGKGLSTNSRSSIKKELSRRFKSRIVNDTIFELDEEDLQIADLTCGELFFEFQRRLMA